MAIGGFNGSDPAPTLSQFESYVAEHKIHYFISVGGSGGSGPNSSGTGTSISSWVAAHFKASTVDGVTVYDLTTPREVSGREDQREPGTHELLGFFSSAPWVQSIAGHAARKLRRAVCHKAVLTGPFPRSPTARHRARHERAARDRRGRARLYSLASRESESLRGQPP